MSAASLTTIYRICPHHGFDDTAAVVGAGFAGELERDSWIPYRQFTEAFHRSRLGHLLRRSRHLLHDHPRARFPARIARILHHALAERDRHAADTISAHGADVARGHMVIQLRDAVEHVGPLPDMPRFARHLMTQHPAILSFLVDPALDATNWRAEQPIRLAA